MAGGLENPKVLTASSSRVKHGEVFYVVKVSALCETQSLRLCEWHTNSFAVTTGMSSLGLLHDQVTG